MVRYSLHQFHLKILHLVGQQLSMEWFAATDTLAPAPSRAGSFAFTVRIVGASEFAPSVLGLIDLAVLESRSTPRLALAPSPC